MPFFDKATNGERYGPAMTLTTQGEADRHFEELVEWQMRMGRVDRAEAERIERTNLGYMAGYYGNETRGRVERLFRCTHPVFGPIAERGSPTAEGAFQMGVDIGARAKVGEHVSPQAWREPRSRWERILEDD